MHQLEGMQHTLFKQNKEYSNSTMSLLYYWGKPISSSFPPFNPHHPTTLDSPIIQISSGEKHCIILMEKNLFGFGDNQDGELGSQLENQSGIIPIVVPNKRIYQVSCGWNHTLLLAEGGEVYSSGRGEHGELGRGRGGKVGFQLVLGGAKQVSAGKDHSLALCGSKVMGWGNSKEGQLGLLTKKSYYHPHQLNVYPATFVFAGARYSLFVTSKGVYGTGVNHNCQLGLGHENDVSVPRKLSIDEDIVSICGGNYCAARTIKGEWYLWGSGGFGVFKYPTRMSFLRGGESVTMGQNFGLLSRNGEVWVWGSNRWGELGIDSECKDYACQAAQISSLNLKGFSCGCNFMVGFTNEGSLVGEKERSEVEEKLSECYEEQNSSITRQLFKNFKNSSGEASKNSLKDRKSCDWNKFYEIQHDYDIVGPSRDPPFIQNNKTQLICKPPNEGHMTWQGEKHNQRRVKLSESLKSLTNYEWSLQKENSNLKERLHHERLQKEKMRSEYLHLMSINEDNKIYNKILKLESQIHNKNPPKSSNSRVSEAEGRFMKKLHCLRQVLESAYND